MLICDGMLTDTIAIVTDQETGDTYGVKLETEGAFRDSDDFRDWVECYIDMQEIHLMKEETGYTPEDITATISSELSEALRLAIFDHFEAQFLKQEQKEILGW